MPDPLPYKTVAVASTFSPRFKQVLAEAKRIGERFSAQLHLIYVGERNDEIAKKFGDALEQLDLPLDSRIHYEKGDPADAILGALAREKIDVIVAGALEKEVVLHPFLGNVARRLVREAPCSVMLFTTPAAKPKPLRRIVFVADHSDTRLDALKRTLPFAAAESCERLYVIRIITTFDRARASIRGNPTKQSKPIEDDDEEEEALEKFVLSAGATDVPIEARCIRGNTGLAASDFVQSMKADLLVVPLQKKGGGTQLPSNIAWVTDVIPCNLWVIR
jgi:nucleotide-binding universal stress UspA family protein